MPGTVERNNQGGLGLDCKSMKPSSQLVCMLSGSIDDFSDTPPPAPRGRLASVQSASAGYRGWKTRSVGTGAMQPIPHMQQLLLLWV